MAMTKLHPLEPDPETYHGFPVLEMHVGDPIPIPRAPERYAVMVGPDLARYLLTFNPPNNRGKRTRKIRQMASDMKAKRWLLTPQGPIFGPGPLLINGQNTLFAIIESGCMVWQLIDFGWPLAIMSVIDHATGRTNADTLHIAEVANSATVSAIATRVWQYGRLVGSTRSIEGMEVPSSPEVLEIVDADPDAYQAAARDGKRIYERLDKACGPAAWGTAHYLIAKVHPDRVSVFFDEIAEESGEARSATRELARFYRRRPQSATKTGDNREPLELMIRAFNGWVVGRSFAFPKFKGFPLSRIRPA